MSCKYRNLSKKATTQMCTETTQNSQHLNGNGNVRDTPRRSVCSVVRNHACMVRLDQKQSVRIRPQ